MLQKTICIALLFCLIASGYLPGQVPDRISYQGMLTGNGGEIVEDGLYEMKFNLYGETDTSTPLWSETQNVTIVNGVFNVILGTVNSLELPFDEQYYLGIAVGDGAELSPRIALTSAAYSFRTKSIEDGQVVKSINELKDDIQLEAGENVSIAEDQNKIIISAASTGGSGNITQITAGDGLTGGGSEGEVTLAVEDEGITAGKLADGAVTQEKIHPDVSLPISGDAGGDLTGTYPDPEIGEGVVTTSKLADGAVGGSKIADKQVIRSINDLTDAVHLTGGDGVAITTKDNTIHINAEIKKVISSDWQTFDLNNWSDVTTFFGQTRREYSISEEKIDNEIISRGTVMVYVRFGGTISRIQPLPTIGPVLSSNRDQVINFRIQAGLIVLEFHNLIERDLDPGTFGGNNQFRYVIIHGE